MDIILLIMAVRPLLRPQSVYPGLLITLFIDVHPGIRSLRLPMGLSGVPGPLASVRSLRDP